MTDNQQSNNTTMAGKLKSTSKTRVDMKTQVNNTTQGTEKTKSTTPVG